MPPKGSIPTPTDEHMDPTIPPISRNLYREDEVIASLKWCILKGRIQEAVFWAQEGVDSGLLSEVLRALLWSWMFGFGASYLSWLQFFRQSIQKGYGSITNGDILSLVTALCRNVRSRGDSSVVALLSLGLSPPPSEPDRVGMPTLPAELIAQVQPHLLAAARALRQGKVLLGWDLLRTEWDSAPHREEVWALLGQLAGSLDPSRTEMVSLFENAPSWLGPDLWSPTFVWPLRAIACAAAARQTGPLPVVWNPADGVMPPEVMNAYGDWVAAPMRFRRVYAPPQDCLYWFTARGAMRVNESTERDIRDHLEDAMRESRFWARYRPEMVAHDYELEIFYTTFFPTDIPDEWSTKARHVSHGFGTVPVGDTVDHRILFERCLNRWFQHLPSRFVWNGLSDAVRRLTMLWGDPSSRPASLEEGLTAAYEEQGLREAWVTALSTWNLEPVRRELTTLTLE